MSNRGQVLLLTPSFPPDTDGGGPSQSLKMITLELIEGGWRVVVVTKPARVAQDGLEHDATLRSTEVARAPGWSQVRAVLGYRHRHFDHVVISSFWHPLSLAFACLRIIGLIDCRDAVLTPRGQLNAGPLATSPRRKKWLLPVYRALYKRGVDRVIATSEAEQQAVQLVLGRHVLLARQTAAKLPFQSRPPASDWDVSVAFVSRIHPRKGLLEALRSLEHVTCTVAFFIAGPIQDQNYWSKCKAVISRLEDERSFHIEYLGLLGRDGVQALLSRVDAMVLVSSGENFGHTIAEALQIGTRVVVAPDTPWSPAVRRYPEAGAVLEYPLEPRLLGKLLDEWGCAGDEQKASWRKGARQVFDDDSRRMHVGTVTDVLVGHSPGDDK